MTVVVVDDARLSSVVRWSGETELTTAVARTRNGRRVRLALGTELVLAWFDLGEVRCRRYCLDDVLGGSDPQWKLRPLAPAEPGNRRLAPRAGVVVPVGVHGSEGLVVGTSIDLSISGARIAFPPSHPLRPLPEVGDTAQVVLVLDEARLELLAEIVRVSAQANGSRELRASFTDLEASARESLRSAVEATLPRGPAGRRPARPPADPVS